MFHVLDACSLAANKIFSNCVEFNKIQIDYESCAFFPLDHFTQGELHPKQKLSISSSLIYVSKSKLPEKTLKNGIKI